MAFLEYKPTSPIFHYTDWRGFAGICNSKTIWFSDLRNTNDPRELILGMDIFKEAMSLVRSNDFPSYRNTELLYFEQKIQEYIGKGRLYSASFTKNGDMLPMWNFYGDECRGLSIGFRPAAIADMPVRVQKANYLPGDALQNWRILMRDLLYVAIDPSSTATVSDEKWRDLYVWTVSAIVCAKHKTWIHEEEVRCTHAGVTKKDEVSIRGVQIPASEYSDGKPFFTEINCRKRGEEEVYFTPIPFGKYRKGRHEPNRAIDTVIIGPKSSLSLEHVKDF